MSRCSAAVYISGRYGPGNLGDDVLLLTTARLVSSRISASDICIRVNFPDIAERWLPGIHLLGRQERSADVVALIYGGGGQFFSFPLTTRKNKARHVMNLTRKAVKASRRPRQLVDRIQRLAFSSRQRDPVTCMVRAAFCVGVGPFVPSSPEIKAAGLALAECSHISVRDPDSLQTCVSLGIREPILGRDPCFLGEWWGCSSRRTVGASDHSDAVAFVVRHWPHDAQGATHVRAMLKAARMLRAEGVGCTFVSLSRGYDETALKQMKGEDVLCWEASIDTPAQFVARLSAEFDLVVSARAHGIMLPAVSGVPGICVEIEPKLRNVHRVLPEGTLTWGPPFCAADLVRKVEHMLHNRERFTASIAKEVATNARIAGRAADALLGWLDRAIENAGER